MERLWTFTATVTEMRIGHRKDRIIQKVAEKAVFIVIQVFCVFISFSNKTNENKLLV